MAETSKPDSKVETPNDKPAVKMFHTADAPVHASGPVLTATTTTTTTTNAPKPTAKSEPSPINTINPAPHARAASPELSSTLFKTVKQSHVSEPTADPASLFAPAKQTHVSYAPVDETPAPNDENTAHASEVEKTVDPAKHLVDDDNSAPVLSARPKLHRAEEHAELDVLAMR